MGPQRTSAAREKPLAPLAGRVYVCVTIGGRFCFEAPKLLGGGQSA